MKNLTKLLRIIALAAVIGFSFTACNDKPDPTTVPNPVTITQGTPNGLAFAGKVTIRSDDKYTDAEWDAIVKKVITALNAAYEGAVGAAINFYINGFSNDKNAQIVLVNNLAHNWQVKENEIGILYLKTGSIATANYSLALQRMSNNTPDVGNAAPPQRGVFLAKVLGTKNGMYAI